MGWEKSTDVLDEIETKAEYDGYFCTDNCCSWELEKQNLKRNRAVTGVLDGKTIRSTAKMSKYESPLHIISAYASEIGMTLAQKAA